MKKSDRKKHYMAALGDYCPSPIGSEIRTFVRRGLSFSSMVWGWEVSAVRGGYLRRGRGLTQKDALRAMRAAS